jgi:hypothetical protein
MSAYEQLLAEYATGLEDFRGILNDLQRELFVCRVAELLAKHFPAPKPLPDPQNDSSANCVAPRPLPDLAPVWALIGAVQIITDPAMRETVVTNWVYWSRQLAAKADAAEMALREAGKS